MDCRFTEPASISETRNAGIAVNKALRELDELGWGPEGGGSFYYKDKIITAVCGELIVGFITFRYEDDGTLWILLGWVDHAHRRQGLYRQLWNKLLEHARTTKALYVAGSTHIDNLPMRAFFKSVGREERTVTGYFTL